VTVTLKDANNNSISGHNVTISSGAHSATIAPSSTISNTSGQAVFTVKSTQAGTATITATDTTASVAMTSTASIAFTAITVTAIAVGEAHTIALKSDGTVWTWGSNTQGRLGDGASGDKTTPVQVKGPGGIGFLTGVTAIAGGQYHSIALKNDGTVWTWGSNGFGGPLGDGTTTDRSTPVQVKGPGGIGFLTGVTAIAGGDHHTIALKNDGTVWAWGRNDSGQLGDGTASSTYTGISTPVQVKGPGGIDFLTDVKAIAGGGHHTIALKNDGTVWTWGLNDNGQLGDGTTTNRTAPVQVSGLTNMKAIAGGGHHTIALKNDGAVWTWGADDYGQLGGGKEYPYGAAPRRTTPAQVSGLTNMTAIAGGGNHTIALNNDGTVWAWGRNDSGQLGDGTTTDRYTPVKVCAAGQTSSCSVFLTNVTAIADGTAGTQHTIVLKNDGTVWGWGSNGCFVYGGCGKLGDGTTDQRTTPVQTIGLP
jgi:alpha-tubulin suppressor-like RCC1 family protein